MGTFIGTSTRTMIDVAEVVDRIETLGNDVHTVTLLLNGQHGEFDLTIEATDSRMEERKWTGIARRSGGVDQIKREG